MSKKLSFNYLKKSNKREKEEEENGKLEEETGWAMLGEIYVLSGDWRHWTQQFPLEKGQEYVFGK